MERFKDNVAIVTDAGTGIGQAIAAGFVEEGACVAFVGRRMEKLEVASTSLPK